jgi:hypothetical protein
MMGNKRKPGRPKRVFNGGKGTNPSKKLTKVARAQSREQQRALAATRRKAEDDVEMNGASESEDRDMEMEEEEDSDDEIYSPGSDRKLSIDERKELGMVFVTQEEVRIAIKVAYVLEYDEPDESDWASIA